MGYMTLCRHMTPRGRRCGALTTNRRGYCDEHLPFNAHMRASPTPPSRRTYRWQQTSRAFLADWVRAHGWLCVGYRREPHMLTPPRKGQRSPLHSDHRTPLARGGAEYDRANLQALCASCNGHKAGHER
jgi:hypothetical protein